MYIEPAAATATVPRTDAMTTAVFTLIEMYEEGLLEYDEVQALIQAVYAEFDVR